MFYKINAELPTMPFRCRKEDKTYFLVIFLIGEESLKEYTDEYNR